VKKISLLCALLLSFGCSQEIKIIDKPIDFKKERIEGTKEYIKTHYGLSVKNINITPKIVVLHWTAIPTLEKSYAFLKPQKLSNRPELKNAGNVNVSAHFLVDRDGKIYRLMPEKWMARHIIGLNYTAIGIENVGGENNEIEDLTPAQVEANIALVKYLKKKYPTITRLIGHHEYGDMNGTKCWLEKDSSYFTEKKDPGDKFMSDVRDGVKDLKLQGVK